MKKSYSAPEINSEKEKNKNLYNNNNEINPVEEIDPRYLNSFPTLASFLDQDGLRNLLSSKMGNKLEGFKLLNSKLDEIFSESNENIIDSVYELIELIGLILEDKNTFAFIESANDSILFIDLLAFTIPIFFIGAGAAIIILFIPNERIDGPPTIILFIIMKFLF